MSEDQDGALVEVPAFELVGSEATLRLLVEAGGRLASILDLPALYQTLLDVVRRAMTCDGFIISSYNRQINEIRCDFAWTNGQRLDVKTLPPVPFVEDGGMQSQVIKGGKPLIFSNVRERVRDPRGKFFEVTPEGKITDIGKVKEPTTQCAAMVPIKVDNVTVGVVQVLSEKPDSYDEDDLCLLEGLVHQLAIAAQNARLYERARQEISDRKRAEDALRHTESRLLQTLDAMPIIAWTLNADGTVDYINKRLVEYGGDDPNNLMGARGWASVVHPDDAPALRENYKQCVATGSEWECEVRLRRRDGVYRWHLSRMVPMRNTDGTISRWFGTSTDIHDMKAAEEMLVDMNEELERRVEVRTAELQAAIREMEGFTYSVSHDLRSPLRTISATSSILLSEGGARLDDDMRRQLERQASAAKRLGGLIDDLLRLSRVSRADMRFERVDLTEIAQTVAEELASREWVHPPKIEIQQDLAADGDDRLIHFVFLNLIENAVKFSPEGAEVTVGVGSDGVFFVQDQGVGLDVKYADKIWMPFERLVRDDEYPGTGIGLANVKRIVERHRGRIWVESVLGKGATFFFTLAP